MRITTDAWTWRHELEALVFALQLGSCCGRSFSGACRCVASKCHSQRSRQGRNQDDLLCMVTWHERATWRRSSRRLMSMVAALFSLMSILAGWATLFCLPLFFPFSQIWWWHIFPRFNSETLSHVSVCRSLQCPTECLRSKDAKFTVFDCVSCSRTCVVVSPITMCLALQRHMAHNVL